MYAKRNLSVTQGSKGRPRLRQLVQVVIASQLGTLVVIASQVGTLMLKSMLDDHPTGPQVTVSG